MDNARTKRSRLEDTNAGLALDMAPEAVLDLRPIHRRRGYLFAHRLDLEHDETMPWREDRFLET